MAARSLPRPRPRARNRRRPRRRPARGSASCAPRLARPADTFRAATAVGRDDGRRLAELAARAAAGETIVLTRDGTPVADLVPHHRQGGLDLEAGRRYLAERGIAKLATYVAPDFDEPLPEDFFITPNADRPDR